MKQDHRQRGAMSISVEQMAAHIDNLVQANEITVNFVSDECGSTESGYAAVALSEIWIPTISSYKTYCTALHEIGHILGEERLSADRMTRERDAWKWAEEHALEWNEDARDDANDCLFYYEKEIAEGRLSATCEPDEILPRI